MTTAIQSPHTVRNRLWICTLSCLAGIALNLVLRRLAALTGLPLYLDCVGTILTAILGGYLPGMIVGYVTNLLLWIWDPNAIFFSVTSVLIAAVAAGLAWRNAFRSFGAAIRTVPLFALIGGGLGSVLT